MLLFAIIWVLSPLFLIPFLIIKISENKRNKLSLQIKEEEIARLRSRLNGMEEKAVQPQQKEAEPVIVPEGTESVVTESAVLPEENESVVTQTVVLSEANEDIASVQPDEVETVEHKEVVTQESDIVSGEYHAEPQNMVQEPSVDEPAPVIGAQEKAVRPYTRTSGVYMFGIGVLLVFVAGSIFATTNWRYLSSFSKIAVLLGAVAVCYLSAWFSQKKLDLRETSITFYILGSGALGFTNLAAGYFGWYGLYYSGLDRESAIIWAVSAAIISFCLFIGRWLYDTVLMGIISYFFGMLTMSIFTLHVTDDLRIHCIMLEIFMLGSLLLTQTYEKRTGSTTSLRAISRFLSYIIIPISVAVAIFGYGDRKDAQILGIVLFFVMSTVGVILACILYLEKTVASCICLLLSVIGLCMCDRFIPNRFYDLALAWFVMLIFFTVSLLRLRKDASQKHPKVMTVASLSFAYALSVFTYLSVWNKIDRTKDAGFLAFLIPLLLLSLMTYAAHTMSDKNYFAVISAIMSCAYATRLAIDVSDYLIVSSKRSDLVAFIILEVMVFAIFIISRLIQRPIIKREEEKCRIAWMSLAAFIPAVTAIICADGAEGMWRFWACTLLAVYIVLLSTRVSRSVQKVFLTVASAIMWINVIFQPFLGISDEFIAEWIIFVTLLETAVVTFIFRENKNIVRALWTVVTSLCFIIELVSISNNTYENETVLMFIKIATYLAGVIVVFIVSYVRKIKPMLIETGFALMIFSLLAEDVDAPGIFILAALVGVAYMIYLHAIGESKWSFTAILQIYFLLFIYEPPYWILLIAFATSTVCGFILHRYLDVEQQYDTGEDGLLYAGNKTWLDDWINISGIIPTIALMSEFDEDIRYLGVICLSIFVLSFYRRFNDDRYAKSNLYILTAFSIVLLWVWMGQPWWHIPKVWRQEWFVAGIMLCALFNMLVVYKEGTDSKGGWITFVIACMCSGYLLMTTLSGETVSDAVALGIFMTAVIIWSYLVKKKQWFIMSTATLALLILIKTKEFWTSIAWWVYLLTAGIILIGIATANEYAKHNGRVKEKHVFFKDWTY